MRLYFNPDLLFKDVDPLKVPDYYNKIVELCVAIDKSKSLSSDIIAHFKFKKMRGTNSIYKFYLNNQDATRCLVMYENKDSQIFESEEEPGLILLRAVSHQEQGKIARKIEDKPLNSYERFLIYEEDVEGDDLEINQTLGKAYLKEFPIHHDVISTTKLLEEMKNISQKGIYKLSENQLLSLNAKGPVFLMGSAGSGKTLVEICKALKNAHNPLVQGYFTYTPLLKDTASKIYQKYTKIKGLVGTTEFHIIKDYFLENLSIPETKYFSFDRFLEWFKLKKQNPNKNYKLIWQTDPIDIWTEIRGLIKGFLGHTEFRIQEFYNKGFLDQHEINELTAQSTIKRMTSDSQKYLILNSDSFHQFVMSNNKFLLKRYLDNQDLDHELLEENSYINEMKSHYSRFNKQERKVIYDFVKLEYSTHLKENGYVDDNDLARLLLKRINQAGDFKHFDKILVDEVQDLTEFQIYAIIKLCKDPFGIYMAGDVSQVINPTFFHQGRLGFIFRTKFNIKSIETLTLNENYRNSENIVKVLEVLLNIRRETIGKYSYDIEEVSNALETKEGLPIYLNISDEDINTVIDNWVDVPGVAIIVPTQEVKKQIYKKLNSPRSVITNLYTVQEIKGQEFDKIISYNMMSYYSDAWQDISNKSLKRGTDDVLQYRFYFNTLYVAITRGKTNLYFYERNKDLQTIHRLLPYFEEVKENAIEVTNVSTYDTIENQLKQAYAFFQNQEYPRAYRMYLKANNKHMARVSTGFHLLGHSSIENIENGLLILFDEKEYDDKLYRAASDPNLWLFKALIGKRLNKLNSIEINKLLEGKNVSSELNKLSKNKHMPPSLIYECLDLIGEINQVIIEKKIKGILE